MTEDDLKELLKSYKLGVRIEFRRKLLDWRIKNVSIYYYTICSNDTLMLLIWLISECDHSINM